MKMAWKTSAANEDGVKDGGDPKEQITTTTQTLALTKVMSGSKNMTPATPTK